QRLWNAHDGCEVYVDLAHGGRGPEALQYLCYGNDRGRYPVAPELGGSDLGMRREAGRFVYEWRLAGSDLAAFLGVDAGSAALRRGSTLGFDVTVCDRDADGSFSWHAWGPGLNKQVRAKSRGNLVLVDSGELATFTRADLGDPTGAVCVAEVGGSLWVGTWSGLRRYTGAGFERLVVAGDSLDHRITALLGDGQGRLWIGTDGAGVKCYDGERIISLPAADPWSNSIFALLQDRSGTMWAAGYGPPRRLSGTSWEALGVAASPPIRYVASILETRTGDLWFGTWGGARRYDGRELITFTTADGLPDNRVTSLVEDDRGRLWCGTVGGLARFDGTAWTSFTVDDGLPDNRVRDLLYGPDGILWIGLEEGGVSRFDGLVFQTLAPEQGLLAESATSLCLASDGAYWIASDYGLTRYRPHHDPPEVHISEVVANRQYGPASRVTVPSTQEYVAFEFGGRSDRTEVADLAYVYRLAGRDSAWSATRQRRVAYAGLPVGEYAFEVRAVDGDLAYSDEPARVDVRVTWPYERLATGLALTLGLLGIAWQTTRVVRRDRRLSIANRALTEANERVQEATRNKSEFLRRMSHDLRSPMNAIIGYTRLVLRKARGTLDDRQIRNLENIQTSSERLLALINDILDLSRIEAGRLELQVREADLGALVTECADALAPLVKPGVELVRQLESLPPVQTDPDRLRQVVMNLLGNAAKFTEQGSITVSLRAADGGAELRVADTGVGIPPEDLPHIFDEFRQVQRQGGEQTEGTGLGLSIARRIVELLGGAIAAESEV
ncbi:MAG: ATP-binding protein, partial [Gemmatimonadota bacterium]